MKVHFLFLILLGYFLNTCYPEILMPQEFKTIKYLSKTKIDFAKMEFQWTIENLNNIKYGSENITQIKPQNLTKVDEYKNIYTIMYNITIENSIIASNYYKYDINVDFFNNIPFSYEISFDRDGDSYQRQSGYALYEKPFHAPVANILRIKVVAFYRREIYTTPFL